MATVAKGQDRDQTRAVIATEASIAVEVELSNQTGIGLKREKDDGERMDRCCRVLNSFVDSRDEVNSVGNANSKKIVACSVAECIIAQIERT